MSGGRLSALLGRAQLIRQWEYGMLSDTSNVIYLQARLCARRRGWGSLW